MNALLGLCLAAFYIARSPIAPIHRPPTNRDELLDDRDYYPETMLKEYADAGVNGLWMLIEPLKLATNDCALAKLARVRAKCARFGIALWPLMIEPEVGRVTCPSRTEDGAAVAHALETIARRAGGLGGVIALTYGERESTCLLRWKCPRCTTRERWQVHNDYVNALKAGLAKGCPTARLIAWFYVPNAKTECPAWLLDCVRHLPKDVIFQYNFESGVAVEQCGAMRVGGDYWLSVPGPGEPFRRVADVARTCGVPLMAKIQTGTSHELATLPYVPVPGLLYRKFAAMKRAGVDGAQLCWFFGGGPSPMLRAAGMLATWDFETDDEAAFLAAFARREGVPEAQVAARIAAWRALGDGYANYPVSNMFQYYGPVHAGATWPLRVAIAMAPLPRSWKSEDTPSGDLIGECLDNHTLQEAETLLSSATAKMRGATYDDVSRAMHLQFAIAADILAFYRLRREAVHASRVKNDASGCANAVSNMLAIVRSERVWRGQLRALAAKHADFGYHSESEDRRYDPAKIDRARVALDETEKQLETLLAEGGAWPLSEHERTAPRFEDAHFAANGDLVIDAPVPNPDRSVSVRLYDVCGTERALFKRCRPTNGRLVLTLPAAEWGNDPARRPGWIHLEQAGWCWPPDPDLQKRPARLGLWHCDGERFGLIDPSR